MRFNLTRAPAALLALLLAACRASEQDIPEHPAEDTNDEASQTDVGSTDDSGYPSDTAPADADTGTDPDPDPDADTAASPDTVADTGVEDTSTDVDHPSRCSQVRVDESGGVDGEYTLYVDGDPTMPWTAWCADMAGTPAEYLSVPNDDDRQNSAYETCGGVRMGWESGTPVYTRFSRVRIDPDTLSVIPDDFTFATSTGECHSFSDLTELYWGFAASCDGSPSGRANVDLTGTPFFVEPDAWIVDGWLAEGSATYSDDGKVVSLTGGGSCGYMVANSAYGSIPLGYAP
jgi:hypothetical protein